MNYMVATAIGTFPWYIIRVSGLLGLGLLGTLMISGIGQVTGLSYRYIEPLKAWAIHKAVALGLIAVVATHVLTLLVDSYMPFTVKQILVPFASHYTNKTPLFGYVLASWGVALGIFAMYGLLVVTASSLGWINSRKKAWHGLHYISYFVMAATLVHALVVGHEFREGSWRLLLLAGTIVVFAAVIARVMRAGSLRRHKPHA